MLVRQAKALARQWVIEEAGSAPGFFGAFLHGSTNWLSDESDLPATSDVDVVVVSADPNPRPKLGAFVYRDAVLDVSYLALGQLLSPELILGTYELAGSLNAASILLDPTGHLADLHEAVSKDYARRRWVSERCAQVRNKVLRYARSLAVSEPLHDQVASWLFTAGVTTHVLLVAGLRNPTVRRRYLAVKELLADYGRLESYDGLLELLGCARMGRAPVERHLAALTEAFDAAKTVVKTPFFFASEISDVARPLAIGGSHELIERGCHREAIFWMVATYARCLKVLHSDAPVEMQQRFSPGFRELIGDLGITSSADLQRRAVQVTEALPGVWRLAEAIMAANPAIKD